MSKPESTFDPDMTLDMDLAMGPTPRDKLGETTAPPASPFPTGAGLEDLSPRDLGLPQLKIRQPQTLGAEDVPEGEWFLSSEPDYHSLVRDLVVLEVRKERSLMLPYAGGEAAQAVIARIADKTGVEVPPEWEGPVCYSHDRIVPVEREGLPVLSPTCAECPMNRWRTVNGRRLQDCAESYRLTLYDVVAQRPCVFHARGAAIRVTRELLAQLQASCERHKQPAFAFVIYATTKRIEGLDGPYYVPVFHAPYLVQDPEQLEFYAALRSKLATATVEEV